MTSREQLEIAVLKRKIEVLEGQLEVKKQKNDRDQGRLETIAMLMRDWNAPGIDKEREWLKMTNEDNLANAVECLELLNEGSQIIEQLEDGMDHLIAVNGENEDHIDDLIRENALFVQRASIETLQDVAAHLGPRTPVIQHAHV